MSPSRAGLSHSSSWGIFSSARLGSWPFPLSSKLKNGPKRAGSLILSFLIHHNTIYNIFSSVSAWKLKCLSSARLGLEPFSSVRLSSGNSSSNSSLNYLLVVNKAANTFRFINHEICAIEGGRNWKQKKI